MPLTKAQLERLALAALRQRLEPVGFQRVAYAGAKNKRALRRTRPWGWQQVTWTAQGRPTSGLSLSIGLYVRSHALELALAPHVANHGPESCTHLWALPLVSAACLARDEVEGEKLAAVVADETVTSGLGALDAFDRGNAPFEELATIFLDGDPQRFHMPGAVFYLPVLANLLRRADASEIRARVNVWFEGQTRFGEGWARQMVGIRAQYDALIADLDRA